MLAECSEWVKVVNPNNTTIIDKIEKLLPTIAQRKCLGVKGNDKESLYCWEVENFSLIDVQSSKDLKIRREQRRLFGQKIQKLNKFIATINEVIYY